MAHLLKCFFEFYQWIHTHSDQRVGTYSKIVKCWKYWTIIAIFVLCVM